MAEVGSVFWHDRELFSGARCRDGLAPATGCDRRSMNSVLLSFMPVSLALRYLLDVQPIWEKNAVTDASLLGYRAT
jgi:hypothetical protein